MIIGFTGTRRGMTWEQGQRLRRLLYQLDPTEVHHGDCVGADEEFHNMVKSTVDKIVIHPPEDDKYRAYCEGANIVVHEPEPYLTRNRHIVEAADHLLATPKEDHEVRRSGTWATIRRAVKADVSMNIIAPSGQDIDRDGSPSLQ